MTAMPAARGVGGAGEHGGLPVERSSPAVGLVHAGEDLHQSRLARAVLTDQRVGLAGEQHRAVLEGGTAPNDLCSLQLARATCT